MSELNFTHSNGNKVKLTTPDTLTANKTFKLPGADGSAGQVLQTDGSGALSFGAAPEFMALGGTETTYESGGTRYLVHTFTSSGIFRCNLAKTVDFLIVGGGGGSPDSEGSYGSSGGGGAGGMVEGTNFSLSAGNYVVTVGAGGLKSNNVTVAGSGGDSSFAGVVAKGGGGGADYASVGGSGGCGGGGSEPNYGPGATTQASQNSGISNIQQFGFDGGQGAEYTGSPTGSGGGGGASGNGSRATQTDNNSNLGGAGGPGRANSISGSSVTYAAGGRGGGAGVQNGIAGGANTGNGASGASASISEGSGANGGSGIVIVRYAI